jgi:multidrug efflux pump subunit AcrB
VTESINGFVINLAEAVLIVLVVLTLAMGWRMGLIIGWALVVTIFGTFVVMKLMGIDLQRVSLGALVVALGMMVDNAIVVADNYSVRLARGMKPLEAAIESASGPSIALLGATVVASMAFFSVYAAQADAGEYGRSLHARLSLLPGMAPAFTIMILIIVALFNAIRPPLVMMLTVPFAVIGITAILAPTQTAFGFMAILGAMSLVGLMIKNSIVLLDEINANQAKGLSDYDSTVAAGVSRLRPVVLGAATTILGVLPLIQDAFWLHGAHHDVRATVWYGAHHDYGTDALRDLVQDQGSLKLIAAPA